MSHPRRVSISILPQKGGKTKSDMDEKLPNFLRNSFDKGREKEKEDQYTLSSSPPNYSSPGINRSISMSQVRKDHKKSKESKDKADKKKKKGSDEKKKGKESDRMKMSTKTTQELLQLVQELDAAVNSKSSAAAASTGETDRDKEREELYKKEKERLSELEEENAELKKANEELNRKLEAFKAVNRSLVDEIEERHSKLNAQLVQKQNALKDSEKKVKELRAQLSDLQRKLETQELLSTTDPDTPILRKTASSASSGEDDEEELGKVVIKTFIDKISEEAIAERVARIVKCGRSLFESMNAHFHLFRFFHGLHQMIEQIGEVVAQFKDIEDRNTIVNHSRVLLSQGSLYLYLKHNNGVEVTTQLVKAEEKLKEVLLQVLYALKKATMSTTSQEEDEAPSPDVGRQQGFAEIYEVLKEVNV